MEDSKNFDVIVEDQKIPIAAICGSVLNLTADKAENQQSCGNICVYNLHQRLIFNCEFCDLKFGDLGNFRRHLYETHNLFLDHDEPQQENTKNEFKSTGIGDIVKKEPLEPAIDLPPSYFTEPLVSCGTIFIHNQQKIVMACGYCDSSKYVNLDMFEKHIRQQHNILEGCHNELGVVPKVEKIKEEAFIITEVAEDPEIKKEIVDSEENAVEGPEIKQECFNEDEDYGEMEYGEEEAEFDEEDEDSEDISITSADNTIKKDLPSTSSSNKKIYTKKQSNESPTNGIKPYECDKCPKSFRTFTQLKDHKLRHLGEAGRNHTCEQCEKRFFRNYDLVVHQRVHTGERPYKCDICDKQMRTTAHLKDHLRRQHIGEAGKRFNCDCCEMKFVTKNEMNVHRRVHTGSTPYQCNICDKRLRTSAHLKDHLIRRHIGEDGKNYNCDDCEMKFITKNELNAHQRVHAKKIHACEHCNKRFKRSGELQTHLYSHTGEKPFECDICHKRFMANHILTVHKKIHMGDAAKTIKCDLCDKLFRRNYQRKVHMRTHTGEKPFKCEICQCCYTSNAILKKHASKKHPQPSHTNVSSYSFSTNELPHECNICHKRFQRLSTLKAHNIRHLGDAGKIYNCDQCDMRFFLKGELTRHQRIHIAETYKCNVCYKKFLTFAKLTNHKRRCGMKRLNCEHCDKTFKHNGDLRIHTRVHADRKPYECDICHKFFRAHSHLVNHKKTHFEKCPTSESDQKNIQDGEPARTFNCEHCDKKFKLRCNLKTHMRVHTGEKPFECDICQKCFGSQPNLIHHKKTHMENTLKCEHCDKCYKHNRDLKKHMKKHSA